MGTQILKDFRIRIHDLGTTTPVDGTVDFTLTALGAYPDYGNQIIHPARSRTETSPWRFEVVDASSALTTNLADGTSGRMHLLGRLVEVQDSTDGGAWTTVCIGRMSDLSLAPNPANYIIEVSDERWMERRAVAFDVADTSQLWPPGLRYQWRSFPVAPMSQATNIKTSGSRERMRMEATLPFSPDIINWIREDVVDDPDATRTDGEGNFNHLRLELDGTDYEILTFDKIDGSELTSSLDGLNEAVNRHLKVWIWAPSLPAPANGSYYETALWAPTAPPSPTLPLHLGVKDASHTWGYRDPWDFIPAAYDALGVRYDSSTFTALKATAAGNTEIAPRLTAPVKDVAKFLDDRYYANMGVVAFVDSQGRVAPRSIRLPVNVDPDTLFQFDEGNLRTAPTWEHLGRDIVNVVVAEYDFHKRAWKSDLWDTGYLVQPVLYPVQDNWPADLLVPERRSIRKEHDNITNLGEHEVTFDLSGFSSIGESGSPFHFLKDLIPDPMNERAAWLAGEAFERWGDGAQRGQLQALRQVEDGTSRTPEDDVEPGDVVKVRVDTFPNAAANARTGTRLVQIMSRRPVTNGIDFEFVDVGPSLQPLAIPTVSIAQNSGTPKHAVDVTTSGVPAGASAQIELGIGGATDWIRKLGGLANGVHTISRLPSGTTIYVHGRSAAPGRTRSDWSASDNVATTALTAPSGLSPTQDGESVILTWTNGEASYPVMPTLDGVDFISKPLPAGSTWFRFSNVGTSSASFGVKHVDAFGGASSITSTSTSGTTANTLTAPSRLRILQGWGSTAPLTPEDPIYGHGVELAWNVGEAQAPTVIQYDTSVAFDADPEEIWVPAGQGAARVSLPTGSAFWYFRASHERPDHTDSSYSSIVSAKPVFFTQAPGQDGFPGGWFHLSVTAAGVLQINVGSTDPDSEKFFYSAALNPGGGATWPDAEDFDTAYNSVEASSFPYIGDCLDNSPTPAAITYTENDVVYVTGRFWNERLGFGQTVYAVFPLRFTSIPRVNPVPGQSGSTGSLLLEITDPAGAVTGVWFKTVVGQGNRDFSDPTDESWTEDESAPYSTTVALSEKHNSIIAWAVSYDIGNGTEWLGKEGVLYDIDLIPSGTGVAVIAADGEASANLFGDNDVLSWKIAASVSATPSEATVRAASAINSNSPGVGSVGTLLTVKDGETVYYAAFPYSAVDAGGTEGELVTFEGVYVDERNKVRNVSITTEILYGNYAYRLAFDVGPSCESVFIHVSYINVTPINVYYNKDTTPGGNYNAMIGDVGSLIVPFTTTGFTVRITPYDADNGNPSYSPFTGTGNAGKQNTFVQPDGPDDGAGTGVTDGSSTYVGKLVKVGTGLGVKEDIGETDRGEIVIKADRGTAAPGGTPDDGQIYLQY